ncbi:hypothetical protein MYCTH_2124896 [Thermothelomyces thermophilus ATCC 42464]|uniref:Uncharacterized protein n=1 Tax=Thermothelomyces thermophilus (strain ATCC 42464 / BCRC 31852 / DSM 1799) TaxID=573729 RepID=G2QAU0_THET4|nr:uncharacterized protein MYCTH_2124896 [Thermothelomyces thermophilus ATCC 42464]AEO55932.1 hypothetical protein MYCTH_2124896 [Thermothelomyces thermophilus ATCC 42464]
MAIDCYATLPSDAKTHTIPGVAQPCGEGEKRFSLTDPPGQQQAILDGVTFSGGNSGSRVSRRRTKEPEDPGLSYSVPPADATALQHLSSSKTNRSCGSLAPSWAPTSTDTTHLPGPHEPLASCNPTTETCFNARQLGCSGARHGHGNGGQQWKVSLRRSQSLSVPSENLLADTLRRRPGYDRCPLQVQVLI